MNDIAIAIFNYNGVIRSAENPGVVMIIVYTLYAY